MKRFLLLILLTLNNITLASSIRGVVEVIDSCKTDKVMVWLGTVHSDFLKRKLLMHTEVPVGGTFEFYVRPGNYEIRGSNELGCGHISEVKVTDKVEEVKIKLML